VGLRPAATFVAIRVAFWLGAAATLIWAPAPDRRLIGDAYGPASDFLFRSLSQWDARWFLQIAMHGYEEVPQAAAFFPVYPAVVHGVAWVTGSILVAGVLVSLVAGAVAAWVLAQIARPLLGRQGAHDTVLYLALYPVAFVATSLYSEGLFLALAAGSFLAALRGRPLLAGVLGGFATGTRLLGLALLPALALLLWRGRDAR
jgi:Gpi18-like mannosyltransferase